MSDSIFTKIIRGEVPSHKVYEDDKTLAFLDIHPIQPGHTLVIPKTQVAFMWDLSEEDYAAVMDTTRKVARRLREVYPEHDRVGVHIEGLGVKDHAHVNIFPFSTQEQFRGHMDEELDDQAMAEIAGRLRF